MTAHQTIAADEIESRIGAAINGTRTPCRSPSQGMAPPEKAGWGETTLETIRERRCVLRDEALRLAKPHESGIGATEDPALTVTEDAAPGEIKLPKLRETKTSIAARLRTRGCRICDYLGDVAFSFFAKTQYALYLDEKAQAQFAATRGSCALHIWQLHAVSSPSGESVGLARLVEQPSRLLAQSSRAAEPQAAVSAFLPNSNDCRVFDLLREAQRDIIPRLAGFLEKPVDREICARSQGARLRHLVALIESRAGDETTRFLLAEAAEDMQSYAMKRGATRNALTDADEKGASLRALIHLAGPRNVCAPWRDDGEI